MAGAANYRMFVTNRLMVPEGEYFFVSMGGRVYRAKNDSVSVSNALFPMCGQVLLKIELLPMKDESDLSRQVRNADSIGMWMGQNVVVAMEDQFRAGQPSRLDKARDSYGDVRSNVLIVELRPTPFDYGKTTNQCPAMNGPIVQNPCDPTKGPCPIDTAKCDPTRQTCTQPPPCDPALGPCGPVPPVNNGQAPLYLGSVDAVKAALVVSQNTIGVIRDSTGAFDRVSVNLASLMKDPISQMVGIADLAGANKFAFMSDFTDKMKLLVKDGLPMAGRMPNQPPVNNPPPDTTNPVVTNPDTTKPPVYRGTLENLQAVLNQKNWKAVIPTPQGPVQVNLASTSLHMEGDIYVAADAGNAARLFIFMGDKMDPTKVALDPMGMPMVREKIVTAGP
jgi:hypothetical protein